MKSMLIVFFIAVLLLMIILFPFKVRLMTHFNVLSFKGYYSFKIWRFKLLCGKIERDDNGEFKITNANNILKGDLSNPFIKSLSKEILDRIELKKIEIFFSGGFINDSFSSAMMCGTISSAIKSIYGYLSLMYEDVKLYEDINPTYDENNLELTFSGMISISLFKLFTSVIGAVIKTKKEIKNEG